MNIHFESKLDETDVKILQSLIGESHKISWEDEAGTKTGVRDVDYLVAGRPSAEFLDDHRELRGLIIPWVGPPKATVELIRQRPWLPMYNIHHNAVPVAEMALGLLLAAARLIALRDRQLRSGDWDGSYHMPTTILRGKKVLLLGYGAISRELEPVLKALGMEFSAVRRSAGDRREVHPISELDNLLPECDVLINTLPLTPETEELMDSRRLSLMKSSAIVVNVGRGRVFSEKALFASLAGGKLQAAGLDVWYRYPRGEGRSGDTLPAEQPFWELDNVVLSPHIGGEWPNPEVQRLRMEHIGELLKSLLEGRAPDPIDPEKGY